MPGGDRTGPMGAGPMTGRRAGSCAGYDVPGSMNPFSGRGGRGFRCGFQGGGRGWRHQYYATGVPGWARGTRYSYPQPTVVPAAAEAPGSTKRTQAEELISLKEQTRYFKEVLDELNGRVNELQDNIRNASEPQQGGK